MARRPNITQLVTDFQEQMDELYQHIDVALWIWDDRKASAARGLVPLDTPNLHRIYENTLVEAVVSWQDFAAKWVTYAIACDASVLRSKMETVRPAAFDLTGKVKIQLAPQPLPSVVTVKYLEAMLADHRGFFSVNEKSAWDRYVGLMENRYATAARKLTADDHLLLELCRQLRNVSAHRSSESVKSLTQVVTSAELQKWDEKSAKKYPKLSRQRGIAANKLGLYLAAEQENPYEGRQNTRLAFLLGYMKRAAGKLYP